LAPQCPEPAIPDAELLTKVLGPSTALSCKWLTTTYDDLHTIALLSHADLSEHGLTSGAALVVAGADLLILSGRSRCVYRERDST
jgi:hypothetical protein